MWRARVYISTAVLEDNYMHIRVQCVYTQTSMHQEKYKQLTSSRADAIVRMENLQHNSYRKNNKYIHVCTCTCVHVYIYIYI